MPVQKINPKEIFASNAPAIDTPPVFGDKTKGWDVSRNNDGRPTIKQMNKVQQDTDLKILWLNENSTAPYDETIDYADGIVVLKDGKFQQKDGSDWVEFIKPVTELDASSVKDESGISQQEVNNALKVNSISELIAISPVVNGMIANVKSYFDGRGSGGDLFVWSTLVDKNKHDGGYIIDPTITIPSLSEFNTYYQPQNTGLGVWVRLNNKQNVDAENYGLTKATDDPLAVWSCAAIQQAIKKASVQSSTDYYCKTVKVGKGRYFTTNPIVLSTNGSFSARLPALIGGDGGSIYGAELVKTTSNTVGTGFVGGDIDAVIFVSPTVARGEYVYGENTRGFTLSRTTVDVGYGYYAVKSVMGYRGEIQAIDHGYNIYTDDCWMSKLGFLRSYRGLRGIAIRGGTSNFGGQLYVDGAKQHGFDFYGLTYSEILCACDGVGSSLADGGIAYDFSFAKGVSGTFATERHKGTEFYFHYTDSAVIGGLSFHTTPVETSAFKVVVNGSSIIDFSGYNWKNTYSNPAMTTAEIAKYKFINKAGQLTSIKYSGVFNDGFASSGILAQIDNKYVGDIVDSNYVSYCGVVTHNLSLTRSFKRLCFVGKSYTVELLSGSAISNTDRYYTNPIVITGGVVSNQKPNIYRKSSISTDIFAPSNLWQLHEAGVAVSAYLQGYVDTSGWLWVRSSNDGNNLDYKFVIVT